MPTRDFLLPDLGEGLEDAEVVAWRVAEGDRVELNQTLVEVNTAKALVEVPSPWEGVVTKLHAGEGDVVAVGAPLVTIELEPAEGAGERPREEPEPETVAGAAQQAADEVGLAAAEAAEARADEEPRPKRKAVLVGYGVEEEDELTRARRRLRRDGDDGDGAAATVRATPPVRKLAKEMGVDLAGITGSGPDGRITREDVLRARHPAQDDPTTAVASDGTTVIPVRGVRRLVAEKMARSAAEIPHVTTFLTADCTWLMALREQLAREERVSPLAIVCRALIDVVRRHPKLNSTFDADRGEIRLFGHVHLGIATDSPEGLMVPVIRDAHAMPIRRLGREIDRVVEAARSKRAKPEQMTGSTITVSNVGTFGAEFGTPIINHPEAAILALGVIAPRALVVDGQVEARPAVTMSLSFDHRVMDGAEAGRALLDLARLLESPFDLGALPR